MTGKNRSTLIAALLGALSFDAATSLDRLTRWMSGALQNAGFRTTKSSGVNGRAHTGTAAVKRAARKRRQYLRQMGRLK